MRKIPEANSAPQNSIRGDNCGRKQSERGRVCEKEVGGVGSVWEIRENVE